MPENAPANTTLDILRTFGMSTDQLGELLGVRRRQINRWLAGEAVPMLSQRQHIANLGQILDRLREVYDDNGAADWFLRLNTSLGGKSPYQLLQDGDWAVVVRAAEKVARAVRNGVAV